MAAIAIQDVGAAGLAPVTFAAAAAGGDTVATGTRAAAGWELYSVVLIVRSTDAAASTVTVAGVAPVTVPALTGFVAIPVPNEGLNDPSVAVTYSAVANVTVAALRILP